MSKHSLEWIKKVSLWKVILFFTLVIVTLPITVLLVLIIWLSGLITDKCRNFLFWYIDEFNELKK